MFFKKIFPFLLKIELTKKLAILTIITTIIFSIITYCFITRSSAQLNSIPYLMQYLIIIDLVLFLSLAVLVSKKLIALWITRHRTIEGSRLQTKIVIMFSLVATIPTTIVAIFAVIFFNYGIESWFNKKVSTAINESVEVANHYFIEHTDNIKADALAMANDINSQAYDLYNNIGFFNRVVSDQALLRLLSEGLVFRGDKTILARTSLSFSLIYELERLPLPLIERAAEGDIVVLTNDSKDRVRALIRLDRFFDTYLLVGRPIDHKVIQHIHNAQNAADEYSRLKSQIYFIRIQLATIFIIVALLLILSAIWLGIIFAGAIVEPIGSLIYATKNIQDGDLATRVHERNVENDEISILERTFNLMASKLELQRDDLMSAYQQIDSRRHFIETILTELSSGVIVLSVEKNIKLINRAASLFLDISLQKALEKNIEEICPEMDDRIMMAIKYDKSNGEISISRKGKKAIFLTQIIIEKFENNLKDIIITFDDITALVNAQRSAAWKDVARRIAHEIKNPLTPIRLAAERLKKKYSHEVSDPQTFIKYNETIVRNSTDIGKIIEEFANFARMPAPIFVDIDINNLLKDIIFSRKYISPNIDYKVLLSDHSIILSCDPTQMSQVFVNLLKNSEESIDSLCGNGGKIEILTITERNSLVITIKDNGVGFPTKIFERLTEPYITTKMKGTGLGLAIVKKILHDHNASLEFFNDDTEMWKAVVKIRFVY